MSFRFADERGGFTFVAGDESTHIVHLAYGVGDEETVARFHEVATAGYADNGAPGERLHYRPGCHGAFVLDSGGFVR